MSAKFTCRRSHQINVCKISVAHLFENYFHSARHQLLSNNKKMRQKIFAGENAIVIFVRKTTKADWFTRYLSQKQFWVGGTVVSCKEDISTTAVQTIRFFRANTSEFLVVYILEFVEPFDQTIDYETTIKSYLSVIPIKTNFTLAIWQNKSQTFSILKGETFRQNLDDKQVLDEFKHFDPALIGKSAYLKPLNRSFTDFFHLWSRENMKGFANDIDAFFKTSSGIEMLELKRPKEKINTWRPYSADSVNYSQFANYCFQLNYKLTNIAYSEAEPQKIKVFKNVTTVGKNLRYLTANFEITFDDNFLTSIKELKFNNEVSKR